MRRLYAKATDLIGTGNEDSVAQGRAIYQRIFTPEAKIRTSNTGTEPLTAVGPERWLQVVLHALKDYIGTQHLIGTQLVEIDGAKAHMESYVNAWHQYPDGRVYVFLGTYIDEVRHTEGGWRIHDMNLRHDTSTTLRSVEPR